MNFSALSFNDACCFFSSVESDAFLAMLEQLKTKICAEDCPPVLAIGKRYTSEASFEGAWVTIHLFPALCQDTESATEWIEGYEGGVAVDTESLRERFYQCMPLRGVCRNLHRADSGELVCDKGHKCPAHGCADLEL